MDLKDLPNPLDILCISSGIEDEKSSQHSCSSPIDDLFIQSPDFLHALVETSDIFQESDNVIPHPHPPHSSVHGKLPSVVET